MDKVDFTAQRLRELLHYDPETGVFTRRVQTSNRIRVGDVAGSINDKGYLNIRVDVRQRFAHRLAWLYVYGVWPQHQIDHINGVRDDNRIVNLRDVTKSINMQNQRHACSNNKSGLLGASWNKARSCWQAQIKIGGMVKFLGRFESATEAHAAYLTAKRALHDGCTI
jgi:hypothetical protein